MDSGSAGNRGVDILECAYCHTLNSPTWLCAGSRDWNHDITEPHLCKSCAFAYKVSGARTIREFLWYDYNEWIRSLPDALKYHDVIVDEEK